ncbi:carboxylate-amine ligase [Thermosulfuriphilus sp.]
MGLTFAKSLPFSLGVEIELQVLDAQTLALSPEGPLIYHLAQEKLGPLIKPEALSSMVELVTPVCLNVSEVDEFLRETLAYLFDLARGKGLLLWPASLHPFSLAKEQKVWDHPRYRRIFDELQLPGRRFIAQGLHIHLGMESTEMAVKVYNWLRPLLPVFLALSTSSPFYEGQPSGLYSYRSKLFEALPLAGLPRFFEGWSEFSELVDLLCRLEVIDSVRDLWWDIRLHPDFGTVEIRIYDVPTRYKDILCLVALTWALAVIFSRKETPPPRPPLEIIRYNKWQAGRHGLEGIYISPGLRRSSFKEEAESLGRMALELEDPISQPYIESLWEILSRGTGAHRMLALYEAGAPFKEIIQTIFEEFWR